MAETAHIGWLAMGFPERLITARRARGLIQQQLAEEIDVSLTQLKRYESGKSEPTLDVIRRLAVALSVTADHLIFGDDQRGPDDDLRLEFEALASFSPEEKRTAKALLKGLILKHQAERWTDRQPPPAA